MLVRLGGAFLVLCVALPSVAAADSINLSSKSRVGLFQSQLDVLDNRAASQYSGSIRLQPPRAIVPGTPQAFAMAGNFRGPFVDLARGFAAQYDIPEALFLRLVQQESGWNAGARSHKGAIGLAQLMPQTAKFLRVNAHDPKQNLEGGARYLRQMYDRFGSWRLALAAYNAGPEAVAKYRGIPPYSETQKYVRAILGS
ncbi:MAG: lytic transglycosylase domain-containing protein [Marinosulfonomonas sp.]|nr:lytic transglycosylase domain-containing protein [Marinosulfonomonas sp.]